jgi:hypothetical protein
MIRNRSLLLTMAAAAAFVAFPLFADSDNGNNPPNDNGAWNLTIPVGGSVTHPCTGEVVQYSGECHEHGHYITGNDGDVRSVGEMNCHADGLGSDGNRYVYNYSQKTEYDNPAGCAAGEVNFTDSARTRTLFVATGPGENFWTTTTSSATFYGCPRHGRPDPPVVVIESESECR